MSDDIVELIDGALRDYTTSTDAMRWTPEPMAEWGAGAKAETVTLDNSYARITPSATLPPGHARIMFDDMIMYEGPIGEWPR